MATGDVFLGLQALKLGLVDRLITSDEYIAEKIRHGSRVLKLVNYHRQPAGLSGLFAPHPRRVPGLAAAFVKVLSRATLSLLAFVEGGATSAIPAVSAESIADDIQIH